MVVMTMSWRRSTTIWEPSTPSTECRSKPGKWHISALEIRERVFGESHPDVGQSYSNLAIVYYELDDSTQAHANFESSLRILENHLEEDPDGYEIAAGNYADLLKAEGDEKKAQLVLKRARKALKKYGRGTTTLLAG